MSDGDQETLTPAETRARRASTLSVPPLVLIAAAFFLPTIRACHAIEAPASFAAQGMVWVVPPYLAGAMIAGIVAIAHARRRAPGIRSFSVAVTVVGLCFATVIYLLVMTIGGRNLLWTLWLLVAAGSAVYLLRRGWRGSGWIRWQHVSAAYTALASSFCFPMLASLIEEQKGVGPGAYAYLASVVCLIVLSAWGSRVRSDRAL